MATNITRADRRLATARETAPGISLFTVIRSEWTKMWSLRSTYVTLLALVTLTVGLSVLMTAAMVSDGTAEKMDPTAISLSGLDTGQLVVVVMGVMVISTEYATSSIRTSLIAVPRRLTFLGAKALILGSVVLVTGILTSFAAFFAGQAILATQDLNVQLSDPGVLRAVVGGGLYLAGSAMFGLALAAVLRSTASAIAVTIAGLVVLPQLTRMLPGRWGEIVRQYFTSNAGQQIARVVPTADSLGPWTGYLVFTLWWLVILGIAALLMQRRDA
ncbi:MAG TPA: hypothetical protein VHA53_03650 [Nitrolancea sp.]|jgi:hypothetical protein|nr:hypothetical protein [Nitrolancea sp.]